MKNNFHLPEGYSIRPAKLEDLEAAVEIFNLCSLEAIGQTEFEIADVKNEWTAPGLNPETDQRVVFSPEGKLVAYEEVWALNDTPVHPWVWGRVHPDYKNLGIGSRLLSWAEARAQQVIEKVPAEARVSFRVGTWDTHKPSNDLLQGYGMTLIRHSFQMRINMEEPPAPPRFPPGIEVRTFRSEDAEAVYRADDEAFEDHFGYVPESFESGFEKFKHFFLESENFDPKLWFIAMDGDEIAGISLCRPHSWEDENVGWVSSLGVRRPWRKRGLGLALLTHSFGEFWRRGKRSVGLGVDAQNLTGALKLYKKAGMHVHRQHNLYEKELRPGVELSTISVESSQVSG